MDLKTNEFKTIGYVNQYEIKMHTMVNGNQAVFSMLQSFLVKEPGC